MALRQLILNKKIKERSALLTQLRADEDKLKDEEKELETALDEAETDEEVKVVEESADELEKKIKEKSDEIAKLEDEKSYYDFLLNELSEYGYSEDSLISQSELNLFFERKNMIATIFYHRSIFQ